MTQKCCIKCFLTSRTCSNTSCTCHTQSTNQDWREKIWKLLEENERRLKGEEIILFIQQELDRQRENILSEFFSSEKKIYTEEEIKKVLDRQRQEIRDIIKGMAMDIDEQGIGYFKAIKDILENI